MTEQPPRRLGPPARSEERPPKILIQALNYPPEMIGAGKYTGELAAFLAGQGFAVEVVAGEPHYPGFQRQAARRPTYARTVEAGVEVIRCPLLLHGAGRGIWRFATPLSFGLTAAPVLLWRALRTRPDVILCIEPTLFAAPAAILAATLTGARLALHVQDLEVDAAFATGKLRGPRLRRLALALERLILRRFDAVITISDAMAARLRHKGVAVERVTVHRNWVSAAATAADPHSYRQELGIPSEAPVLLYAGSLGAKQAMPTLLDALHRLRKGRDPWIVIAGEGPMTPLVEAARATLPKLRCLPLQPAEWMGDLLAMADVHVLPQAAAAADLVFPSKLGSLLATGRPVVVTANPGTELARWLGDAAIVVPAEAPDVLATALEDAFGRSGPPNATAQALATTLAAEAVLPAFAYGLARLCGPSSDLRAATVTAENG